MNEVVKTETNSMSALAQMQGLVVAKPGEELIGAAATIKEDIYTEDIIIPKLRLQQKMSMSFEEIPAGQYLNSVTGALMGPSVEILVLDTYKIWQEHFVDGQEKEYIKSELMTSENADFPFDFTDNGRACKRRNGLYFTCALKDDLKKGLKRPYIIDFFASSKKPGRQLITAINELAEAGANSFAVVFKVGAVSETFPNGKTAFVKTITPTQAVPASIVDMCAEMVRDLSKDADRIVMDKRDIISDAAPVTNEVPTISAESAQTF